MFFKKIKYYFLLLISSLCFFSCKKPPSSEYLPTNTKSLYKIPSDFFTVEECLEHVKSGDTIVLEPGDYNETVEVVDKNLFITSMYLFEKDKNIIESTFVKRFSIENSTGLTTIYGISVKGTRHSITKTPAYGGAIYIDSSSVNIENCVIDDCEAYTDLWLGSGGGICVRKSNIKLLKTSIINCSSGSAGAASIGGSKVAIDSCYIGFNSAWDYGHGGIYLGSSEFSVMNTVFENNVNTDHDQSYDYVDYFSGIGTIENCTFINDSVEYEGYINFINTEFIKNK